MAVLVVGLGNPGPRYAGTYHNVGFRVVERLSGRLGVRLDQAIGESRVSGRVLWRNREVVLAEPLTFMNRSGDVLPALFAFADAEIGDLIVVYDDLAIPMGKVRVRQKGSDGGHNGLRSVVSTLASDHFPRVRVGIEPTGPVLDVREYVLSAVRSADQELLNRTEDLAASAVETLIVGGVDKAMALFNGVDLRDRKEED